MQQQLFKTIFKKEEQEADPEMLAGIADRYPYFAAAHFLNLKKSDRSTDNYEALAARTALFFHEPHFLHLQLQKEVLAETTPVSAGSEFAPQIIKEIKAVPKTADLPDEQPIFEPLHATDYFASQGIKLSEDAFANDKLGKQLKSFTAWLKTMKKVHPEKIPAADGSEVLIQSLADKSNAEENVVTEAMAEAYSSQGKAAKAKEILEKLSLQNPSKSAYFAAKIDLLNK